MAPLYQVKAGQQYVLGGRLFKSGEPIEGDVGKFAKVLLGPKGPLELYSGKLKASTVDLPPVTKEVADPPVVATPATDIASLSEADPPNEVPAETTATKSLKAEEPETVAEEDAESDAGKKVSGRGEYQRRDMNASQTGAAKPSSSSRQGRPRKA